MAAKKDGFSDEEREAMKARAREARPRGKGKEKVDGEADLLARIAEMDESDRRLATRLHELVRENAPSLEPKTWYGMPAYALNGKVLCFFQSAAKFKTRYATLGFGDPAALDDGAMWPTAFALSAIGEAEEERIRALLGKAVGSS